MATYNWRVLNGVFSDPNSWTNITTGQDPATTPPGAVDAANFVGASTGTITGTGNVLSLAFNADGTWTLSGPTTSITAANILVNDRTTIANGGALILASTQHTSGTELTIAQGTGSTGTLTGCSWWTRVLRE